MSVLPFIHVAHFADLLVAKVQCRGAGMSFSRANTLDHRIPVAGFEPGTSTSEASEVVPCPMRFVGGAQVGPGVAVGHIQVFIAPS